MPGGQHWAMNSSFCDAAIRSAALCDGSDAKKLIGELGDTDTQMALFKAFGLQPRGAVRSRSQATGPAQSSLESVMEREDEGVDRTSDLFLFKGWTGTVRGTGV